MSAIGSMKSITTPVSEEFARVNDFYNTYLKNGSVFGFTIDGAEQTLLAECAGPMTEEDCGEYITGIRHFTIGDIEIRQESLLYKALPIVEWNLYVKNTGKTVSPKISLKSLHQTFDGSISTLYRHNGSTARPDDHMPYVQPMDAFQRIKISPAACFSTNNAWPYFSVAMGEYGINIAIGWTGQWEAAFYRQANYLGRGDRLEITCGQQVLDSVMLPGEEFRAPRIVAQFWSYNGLDEGKAVRRSQNIFRKYMRDFNMPRNAEGKVPTHHLAACSSHIFCEMINATTSDQKEFIDKYEARGIHLDEWWVDAGWYPCGSSWDMGLGNWRYDEGRYPNGLREIADHAKKYGSGMVLWHEIERFIKDSALYGEHPEFGLSKGGEDEKFYIVNFADDAARKWVTDKVSKNLADYGVTVYRQDTNVPLEPYIRANETPDRAGALENHYVAGLIRYLDDLREQNPKLMLDICCAGGRRQDIDIAKRALFFIRSDYLFEPTSQQCHLAWMSEWMPFFGTGQMLGRSVIDGKVIDVPFDRYALMSTFGTSMTFCFDVRDDRLDWDKIKELYDQWLTYVDCYSGDYYPLDIITLDNDRWAAWQFNRFDEGDGLIQAFRRPLSPEEERVFALNDLIPDRQYVFHRYDTNENFVLDGRTAMENGIKIKLAPRSDAAIKYSLL